MHAAIAEDAQRSAGVHETHGPWRELDAAAPPFADLLAPWVGARGLELATERQIAACAGFVRDHAPGIDYEQHLASAAASREAPAVAEVRTAVESALIASRVTPAADGLRVLEVGGGYGRLAAALQRDPAARVHHVLVESVPVTLAYAIAYLAWRLPDRRIGSPYTHPDADPAAFDCYVTTPWRLGPPDRSFDLAINISSFQEMSDDQVRAHVALLDEAVRPGGSVFLSNSRVYVTERRYSYPAHWRTSLKARAPLSFLPYKPLELMTVTEEDCTRHNLEIDRDYLEALYHEDRWQPVDRLEEDARRLRSGLTGFDELLEEVKDLRQKARRAAVLRDELVELRPRAERYEELVEAVKEPRILARRAAALERELEELRPRAEQVDELVEQVKEAKRAKRRARWPGGSGGG